MAPRPAEATATMTGLSSGDVIRLREQYGENSLPEEARESLPRKLIVQFNNPLIYILLFALLVDVGAWVYAGAIDLPLEAIAILLILIANAGLGLWQDLKSEAALARLRQYTEPHCWVVRNSRLEQIESRSLVPGDLVRLEAGERVPADGNVVGSKGFLVDESVVTGESEPIEKPVGTQVLSGTMAVRGTATFSVTHTGINSTMGKLAALVAGLEHEQTPLERRLARVGRKIAIFVCVVAALLWSMGVLLTGTQHLGELFLFAVALAVAAVPESLPAVITLTLALGVERMAKRKAVVRKMSAVEALGSVTVIATDKTGTITENAMTVQEVEGSNADMLLRGMVLVNDANLQSGMGDPLELGMLRYVQNLNPALIEELQRTYPRISERPFDAQWKYMRVTVREPAGEIYSYFKGAPEVLLALSTLSNDEQSHWRERIAGHASRGIRVLAAARAGGEVETGLEWLGLILLLDPPRPEVADAVRRATTAGIRVLMITGDHPATGREVANQIGIPGQCAISGAELEAMGKVEFDSALQSNNVFARVSPELKYRIVKALQQQDEVVAVTGDGVNDAPALKAADVGVAMGKRGSDVAREVADLVLLDDNFSTIVTAVEEGRNIFENIQKFLRLLFAANLAEVLLITIGSTVMFATATGNGLLVLPLTAVQILWINLLTDSIPALAIAFDRNPDLLSKLPRPKSAVLLDKNTVIFIFGIGVLGSLVSLALLLFLPLFGTAHGVTQTLVFCYLTVAQFAFVNPARRTGARPEVNPLISGAILLGIAAQLLVVTVPALRTLLGITAISWPQAGMLVVLLSLSWYVAHTLGDVLRSSAAVKVS